MEFSKEDYASHQEILAKYCNMVKNGRVIEYGIGHYSTSILHEICQKNDNYLYSIENDKKWMAEIIKKYPGSHWHNYIEVVDYLDLLDKRFDFSSELAFIDAYTWGSRLFCLRETLATRHKYIIIHDSDFIVNGSHKKYLAGLNYINHDDKWPPTLVCSRTEEL